MCIHHHSFWNKQDKKSLSTVVFVLNCCTSFDVRRLSLMSARRDLNICLSGNLRDLTALQGSEGWPCQLWKTKSQTNSSLPLFLPMPSSPCPESFSNIPFSPFLFQHTELSCLNSHLRRHRCLLWVLAQKENIEGGDHRDLLKNCRDLLKNCYYVQSVVLSSERFVLCPFKLTVLRKTEKWTHFPGI